MEIRTMARSASLRKTAARWKINCSWSENKAALLWVCRACIHNRKIKKEAFHARLFCFAFTRQTTLMALRLTDSLNDVIQLIACLSSMSRERRVNKRMTQQVANTLCTYESLRQRPSWVQTSHFVWLIWNEAEIFIELCYSWRCGVCSVYL